LYNVSLVHLDYKRRKIEKIMDSRKNKKKIIVIIAIAILFISAGLILFFSLNEETAVTEDESENEDYDNNLEEETSFVLTGITSEEIAAYTNSDYSDVDTISTWEESTAHIIQFKNDQIEADSSVKVEGSIIYINSSGTYVLSGTISEGQIIILSEDEGTIKLILNGVDITSSKGSPISIENAKETVIIIAEGTTNSITDNSEYVDPDTDETATPAAIYSKDDLYINGIGKLIINSENKNGIQSKDQLVLINGEVTIDAAKEAIKAKDYLLIEAGKLTLTSGEDGISVTEDEDAEKGFIVISGGSIKINSGEDGISAKTYLLINSGTLDITTSNTDNTVSAKGIKAEYYVEINGGTININSADDAIHSDNLVTINNGTITISSGDDGIHSNEEIKINDGTITIIKSYEGIESKNIYIDYGNISITSSDDGINIADSASTSSFGGEMAAISGAALYITGGNLYVNANGDGLDSNGNMYIIVDGPTNNGNGGLDTNGECIVDGGFLVVAGSSGMAESPDQNSKQNAVSISFTNVLPAGTLIHIESSTGEDILTFTPAKTFQSIVLSSDKLIMGETYKIYTDGTLYQEFTISNTVTTIGTVSQQGQPSGVMNNEQRRFR
jgi:hypothetical protein